MKILSKFKDYYDYLQGMYGVDEKLVLDRTNFSPVKYLPSQHLVIELYIGEWLVEGYFNPDTKKFYWGESIKEFSEEMCKWAPNNITDKTHYYIKFKNNRYHDHNFIRKEPVYLGDKSPTWKEKYPILQSSRVRYDNYDKYNLNPILKEYDISGFIEAHDVWVWLSDWLGRIYTKLEPQVPVGDDKVRIQSAESKIINFLNTEFVKSLDRPGRFYLRHSNEYKLEFYLYYDLDQYPYMNFYYCCKRNMFFFLYNDVEVSIINSVYKSYLRDKHLNELGI